MDAGGNSREGRFSGDKQSEPHHPLSRIYRRHGNGKKTIRVRGSIPAPAFEFPTETRACEREGSFHRNRHRNPEKNHRDSSLQAHRFAKKIPLGNFTGHSKTISDEPPPPGRRWLRENRHRGTRRDKRRNERFPNSIYGA